MKIYPYNEVMNKIVNKYKIQKNHKNIENCNFLLLTKNSVIEIMQLADAKKNDVKNI